MATAHVATAAEGTSGLTCLERALSAPTGSIYKPASKWRHRSKCQVASGAAPHTPSGAISFGTVPLPSLPQPQPCTDALDILATPAPPIASIPLTCTPRVMPRQVLDVIARAPPTQVATPVAMHINNHMTTITPYAGGPVAEAIARMAFERARHEEETRLSGQAERDMCAATARVLQRAGRTEQAAAVMLAAPPHVPAPAHTGQTLSLAPSNVISCAPPALASPSEPLAVSWQGSLVAASSTSPTTPRHHTHTSTGGCRRGVVPPPRREASESSIPSRGCSHRSIHDPNPGQYATRPPSGPRDRGRRRSACHRQRHTHHRFRLVSWHYRRRAPHVATPHRIRP